MHPADDIGRALFYFPRLQGDTNCVPCPWIIIQSEKGSHIKFWYRMDYAFKKYLNYNQYDRGHVM